jgi:adenine deaminase
MDAIALTLLSRHLVDVAMGRKSADLVIRNGRWVNVTKFEFIPILEG